MKIIERIFALAYSSIILVFVICGVTLVGLAIGELWHGINPWVEMSLRDRFGFVLECIGWLTIAVVAFELGQTILEEEVRRNVAVSSPTRVRRFLSRFMVVIIVALSIETLVAVFEVGHKDPAQLPYAASIGIAAGVLLGAWGVFIALNKGAEFLEPEAMAEAKSEDVEVEKYSQGGEQN